MWFNSLTALDGPAAVYRQGKVNVRYKFHEPLSQFWCNAALSPHLPQPPSHPHPASNGFGDVSQAPN
ncbi:hypothetical protein C0Q70_09543 [Pomacea canaliculata]|uniref:Uncharacterized protein n=1 Tax=Pomacea canaliculata TaxID=400727 RepID=A0A2T7PA39_POMCA|nr:hypothetical protein C0Q70_09543 [Pomacea canaliculata]